MASAKATIGLEVSPDDVWQLIGFDSLPEWLPYIVCSELNTEGRSAISTIRMGKP